ncbi:hypothetical protein WDU99_06325 [Microbacterium sp. Mu-80]|uniref:Ryanodine receptor Ryr domain-containing protein n=1 Tax=Microbacterium bandirmense TaxID=3122050 RepID=A0ABU8LA50_9MICO
MIPDEHVEALARATHLRDAERRREHATAWERMDASEREANLDSARFAPTILAALGLAIVAGDRQERRTALTPEELEAGARLEHLRWCRFTRSIGRTQHPHLVSWEELDEPVRELDRIRIRALPELLGRLGYSVIDDGAAA